MPAIRLPLLVLVTLVAGCRASTNTFGVEARGLEVRATPAETADAVLGATASVLSSLDLSPLVAEALLTARARAAAVVERPELLASLDQLRPEQVHLTLDLGPALVEVEDLLAGSRTYVANEDRAEGELPELPPGAHFVAEVQARLVLAPPYELAPERVRGLLLAQVAVGVWVSDLEGGYLLGAALSELLIERVASEAEAQGRARGAEVTYDPPTW